MGRLAGSLEATYATGSVEGESGWRGSLVGTIEGGSVDASYATNGTSGRALVGSVTPGLKVESVTNSFFLAPEEESGGAELGEALDRIQFGEEDSFPGWDFSENWVMEDFDEPDFRRPILRENPETP